MLIAQDPDRAAAAEQLDRFMETFVAIEKFDAGAPTQRANVFVDVTIFQRLINGAVAHVTDGGGEHLRLQFPVSDVAQDKNYRPAAAQLAMSSIRIFNPHIRAHLLERHRCQFQSRKKIGAEPLKMPTHKAPHLARRFFRAECDVDVAKSEPSIFAKNEPRAEAQRISERKRNAQRQKADQGKAYAVNQVNEILQHRLRQCGHRRRSA